MAFGKWGKYFYPCLLKENNLIFLDGSKKQNNEKNVLECLLPPTGTPVWAQGKDGDYLEKGEVVAVDVKRRRVKVSQDGFIEWIHRDRLAIQEKERKKDDNSRSNDMSVSVCNLIGRSTDNMPIQKTASQYHQDENTMNPNSHGTVPVPLSAQPACETICAPVTTHLPPADIQAFSASSSLLMEHTSLDPNLHGTEPAPLSAQPACETICAPVTTQHPSADVQDFPASSSLLMKHTSQVIRHKLVQNPDITDATSDSSMSAVFEVQVSTVSSASVHEKKNPTYKQPIDLGNLSYFWRSRHLGHEVDTHKTYYRLHESSVELARISRLLMAVDMGQVAQYKGKTLEDIVIDDLEDNAETCEMGDDGDELDEDGEINLHSHDEIDVLMTISETNTEGVDSGDENRESDIAKGDMYNRSSTDSETDPPTHQRRTCKRIRNQERQNDDTDEETDDEVHATKRVCIRKIKWTEEEVSTMKTAFGHLLMKGLLPGYRQIESLQDNKKCLQRRSKAQIKSKCQQLINKEY